MTARHAALLIPGKVKRGTKPNRMVEQSLHHGPVTGMLDPILLGELRQISERGEELAAAQQIAMQTSWRLHAIVARRIPKV
jgi:hypothetical protein